MTMTDPMTTTRDGDVLTETFGNYLRTQRKRAGFTQRELADKVGVDFTYISKLENNAAPVPSIQTLRRMADAFHITDAQMCAAAGRLNSDLSKQELELYVLQLLKVHENTMEENRALQRRLDAAEQRAERLVECVTAYADPDNWRDESWGKFCEEPEPVCHLGSYYARTALAVLTESEPTDA